MPALNDLSRGAEIKAAMDDLVAAWPDVTQGKMFGSPAYRARGVLFAMIGGEGVITTKLAPEQREAASKKFGAHAFVGRGKEVPAWIEFAVSAGSQLDSLSQFIRDAYDNALVEAK